MTGVQVSERLRASAVNGLQGHIVPPGDKSISHRALILGALAEGETIIEGLLESQDVLHTVTALRAFGPKIERTGEGRWRVRGEPWRTPQNVIDCGNSGTGARLLIGAAAGFALEARFTGDASLRSRPMARLLDPLARMGARFEGDGKLPIMLRGGGLGGIHHVNETRSAQIKSAILLAGLRAAGAVEIVEAGPSRDHTETMLEAFGCEIETIVDGAERLIRLGERRHLTGTRVAVPGDPSSAAFPLVAALLVPGSEVVVDGMLVNPLRIGLLETLKEMGADLQLANRRLIGGEAVADVTARSSRLRGVTVPAARAPSMIDEYPILAIAAACAEGETIMDGIGELRVKESDRLAAIIAGLAACGVDASVEGDRLCVRGRGCPPEGGGFVRTHGDHRIAMSFLILGFAARLPVTVDEPGMIGTSFPDFALLMRSLGGALACVA